MDVVCQGKEWDVALAVSPEGKVAAALPYLIGSKLGLRYILQPQLTQYNGIWYNYKEFFPTNPSENVRLSFEHTHAHAIIDQLDRLRLTCYVQAFSPAITNWQPFYERGFSQSTRYTYRIPDISDPQHVLSQFTESRRHMVVKMDAGFRLEECRDAEWFADFHQRYWNGKGQHDLLSHRFMSHLVAASIAHDSGAVMKLIDADGHVAAALFVVFDRWSAYLLLTAYSLQYYHNNSISVLIWKTLRWLSGRTKAFDFEGSMIPGKERFNRSFGAVQTPFFQIVKYSNPIVRWVVEHRK
ncbi:MAG: GNAT family N-acetyltransferase [Bacteroidales bacterium]|nr:GNAT family N-acetyltransferase [Bacteroidales bacterium]